MKDKLAKLFHFYLALADIDVGLDYLGAAAAEVLPPLLTA